MTQTLKCAALSCFTRFIPGYGQVHANPESSIEADHFVELPEGHALMLADEGLIELPEGQASDAEIVAEVPADPAPEVEQAPAVDEAPAAEQAETAPKKK